MGWYILDIHLNIDCLLLLFIIFIQNGYVYIAVSFLQSLVSGAVPKKSTYKTYEFIFFKSLMYLESESYKMYIGYGFKAPGISVIYFSPYILSPLFLLFFKQFLIYKETALVSRTR